MLIRETECETETLGEKRMKKKKKKKERKKAADNYVLHNVSEVCPVRHSHVPRPA